ncbi:MAG: hypothetical protein MUF66_15895 [Gammaproteobacteria bacterium]|nr:hypothetical protein [Gammaproteobacteria bacterium]
MTGLKVALALLFLNAALSFNNLWPTPAVVPDARLAPEFVALWVVLLVLAWRAGTVSRRLVGGLSLGYLLLVLGRYLDVTAPALFGPTLGVALAALLGLWGLYRLVRLAIQVSARDAAPLALRSRAALGVTAAAVALVAANQAGVEATWPVVSRPVTPTYARQADLLLTALSPARLAAALPASPAFDSDLRALEGRDVKLVFLESYGAVAFDHPERAARWPRPARPWRRPSRRPDGTWPRPSCARPPLAGPRTWRTWACSQAST